MGAEPRPHRSGRGRLCLCPRVRYAACGQTHPPTASTPPPSLKKRSEALKTAFTRLFGMKRRVPPRRRREGAALQGSGGATPCQGAASRRRAGRPGGGRSAKRATAFTTPSGGSSSYSTALDLVKPTAGAQFLAEKLLSALLSFVVRRCGAVQAHANRRTAEGRV